MSDASTPRDAATFIVELLRGRGHVAYFAGGCVRDSLLGLSPKDYDVATDATPQQVAAIFHHTQFVGEAFGVTLVRLKGHSVEVATFRREWGYENGRHPTGVAFCDAQEDARRRDFTINGLFEDPLATTASQRIIDHVGGLADLRAGILRAIGRPAERFAEDYLRMLRAVRFASRFGFTMDDATAQAIRLHAQALGQISRERIGQEMQAMLTPVPADGDAPAPAPPAAARRSITLAARLLSDLKLDGPALDDDTRVTPLHTLDRLERQAMPDADYPAALLAWLIDRQLAKASHDGPALDWLARFAAIDAKAILAHWRKALVLSNQVHDAMTQALELMAQAGRWSDRSVAGRKRLLASPAWSRARAALHALAHRPDIHELISVIDAHAGPLADTGLAPPALIDGGDLIRLGQKPGPLFRRLLDQAYDEQLEGRLTSHDQAIQWLASQLEKESR